MTLCFAGKKTHTWCCNEEQNKQKTNNITNALGNATSTFSHYHSFLHDWVTGIREYDILKTNMHCLLSMCKVKLQQCTGKRKCNHFTRSLSVCYKTLKKTERESNPAFKRSRCSCLLKKQL